MKYLDYTIQSKKVRVAYIVLPVKIKDKNIFDTEVEILGVFEPDNDNEFDLDVETINEISSYIKDNSIDKLDNYFL